MVLRNQFGGAVSAEGCFQELGISGAWFGRLGVILRKQGLSLVGIGAVQRQAFGLELADELQVAGEVLFGQRLKVEKGHVVGLAVLVATQLATSFPSIVRPRPLLILLIKM